MLSSTPTIQSTAALSDTFLAHFKDGLALELDGQLEEAIAEYNEAIRIDPGIAAVYYVRGFAYRDRGIANTFLVNVVEAQRDIERAVDLGGFNRAEIEALINDAKSQR